MDLTFLNQFSSNTHNLCGSVINILCILLANMYTEYIWIYYWLIKNNPGVKLKSCYTFSCCWILSSLPACNILEVSRLRAYLVVVVVVVIVVVVVVVSCCCLYIRNLLEFLNSTRWWEFRSIGLWELITNVLRKALAAFTSEISYC